jgi:hypothetical protein
VGNCRKTGLLFTRRNEIFQDICASKKDLMKKIFTLYLIILSANAMAQSGITWSMGMNIAANTYSNNHPRIALDGSGNPLVIWWRMSDESVFLSRWNGSAFTMPMKLNGTMTVAGGSWMGPQIASKGDTVYVVMKETPEADTSSHIYIIRSFDGGMSFSMPVQIDNIADSISRFPTVAVDDSGNPVVAFMKIDPNFSRARWVVSRSYDYGMTFTPDVLASGWSGGDVCDCCPGNIQVSGNNVLMLYRDNKVNIRDSWVGLSTDGGLTFTQGWNLDGNNWYLPACPSSGPDGVIIGDTLYSVFMNGASGVYRTYKSASSISSMAVQPAQLLTGMIMNLNYQNYPRIASYGSAVAIVWKQAVSSADQLPILFTNDIANGFPAAYDTVDLARITNTDVAVGDGKVFVVWQDDSSATVKYRMGTFTPVSTSVSELGQNIISVYPNPANSSLTVQCRDKINSITVMNILGDVVKEAVQNSVKVDVGELPAGVYFLEVKTGATILNRRFVKSN